jgi:rRNA pseudouridine-1189 N-methylase Emg1 (Nep1/Mra1 family)
VIFHRFILIEICLIIQLFKGNKIPRGKARKVLKFQKKQIPNSKKKQSEASRLLSGRGINPKEIKSFLRKTSIRMFGIPKIFPI